jgi:hypothetical protein
MIRVSEMTWTRLHVLRVRILKEMLANPQNYPDREHDRLSMSDLIDMLIQTLPQGCLND